jgi:small-conductance mechanosensitive channel
MNSIDELLADMRLPDIWQEVGALVLALCLAFAITYLVRRRWLAAQSSFAAASTSMAESVWLGSRTINGVMFALLSLGFTYVASRVVGQWQPLSVLKVAVPILLALVAIRFLARTFALSFPLSIMARMTERIFSWLAWITVVLWVTGLLPTVLVELEAIEFPISDDSKLNLRKLLAGLLSAGAVILVTLWVSALIERRVLRGAVDDLSVRKIMAGGIRALLLLLGVLFALHAVGIDLTALSVMGGALGIGLGLGLQGLAANYVSGFVILFERSVRIGDYIRADDFEGTVKDINTRYTLIQNLFGQQAIVPNEKLTTSRVDNLEQSVPKICLACDLTVAYGCDVEAVQKMLMDVALQHPRVLKTPAVEVYVSELGFYGIEMQISFWIADPHNGQQNVRSQVNVAALKVLTAHNIEMAAGPMRAVMPA